MLSLYFLSKSNLHQFRIENLSKECEKQRQNRETDVHEVTELEQVVQRKKNEVDELNTRYVMAVYFKSK